MFTGLLLTRADNAPPQAQVTAIDEASLPAGDVLVQVAYSTLNYKDGLAITGKAPVVRSYPMVPGIDFAGIVLESSDSRYRKGDAVILNGWGVGESHWGGLAQKARVKADWLVPMPAGMTAARAMSIGTAGYTAMLCVMALQAHGVTPEQGPVLVTGANGGVGSIAIALLARLGFEVHAATGRMNEAEGLYLLNTGMRGADLTANDAAFAHAGVGAPAMQANAASLARVQRFALGDFVREELGAAWGVLQQNATSDGFRLDGMLGLEVLGRGRWTLDYEQQRMYLNPAKPAPKAPQKAPTPTK